LVATLQFNTGEVSVKFKIVDIRMSMVANVTQLCQVSWIS